MDVMKILGRHSPTVMSVEADLLASFFLKNSSSATEAWFVLGDAIREAQGLGLHLWSGVPYYEDSQTRYETLWYDQHKRRLMVHLFNWDAHTALIMGRPRTINESDCTIHLPIDCNMPEDLSNTSLHDPSLRAPSGYSRHLFNNFIARKTHEALALGANRSHTGNYGVVTRIHQEVLCELAGLPPTSNPLNPDTSFDSVYMWLPRLRLILFTFAHSFLIALHRPHMTAHFESRNAVIDSSLQTLGAQKCLYEHLPESQFRTFGISFYTIDAGLVLSMTILGYPIQNDMLMGRVLRSIQDAIERLNRIQIRSPMAASGLKALRICYERLREAYPGVDSLSNVSQGHQSDPQSSFQPPYVAFPEAAMSGSLSNEADISAPFQVPPTTFPWMPLQGGTTESGLLTEDWTNFNASLWTDQMSSILDSNATTGDAPEPTWAFQWP
jgi:hypothetical protein